MGQAVFIDCDLEGHVLLHFVHNLCNAKDYIVVSCCDRMGKTSNKISENTETWKCHSVATELRFSFILYLFKSAVYQTLRSVLSIDFSVL